MAYVIQPHMTKPFCQSGDEVQPPETVSTTVINQETGIPALQSQPLGAGGIPVTRPQFNGMINFYSQQILAMQMGLQYTFVDYSTTIPDWEGYPAGIVLYCASNNSYQRSLVNNNTANFITTPSYINDGVNWSAVIINDIYSHNITTTQRGLFGEGIIAENGEPVVFSRLDNTKGVSFSAPSDAEDQGYILPSDLPLVNNSAWTFNTDGTSQFYDLTQINKIYESSFTSHASGTLTTITNLPAGKYLISAQCCFLFTGATPGYAVELKLIYPSHPNLSGIDSIQRTISDANGIEILNFSSTFINMGSTFDLSLELSTISGTASDAGGFLIAIPVIT